MGSNLLFGPTLFLFSTRAGRPFPPARKARPHFFFLACPATWPNSFGPLPSFPWACVSQPALAFLARARSPAEPLFFFFYPLRFTVGWARCQPQHLVFLRDSSVCVLHELTKPPAPILILLLRHYLNQAKSHQFNRLVQLIRNPKALAPGLSSFCRISPIN